MMHEDHNSRVGAATLSVASNTILVIAKLIIGVLSGSVSIMSEAVHSGMDLVAALIAWFSVRESGKPADEKHPFGHGKIENVSGTIEAMLIFAAASYIIYEAIHKLIKGKIEIEQLWLGAAVMAVSAVVNFLVSRHLMKVAIKTDSIALEADAAHLRTDVYTSAGVLIGLVLIKLTGITMLDPIVAICVALLIIKAAFDLTKSAFFHILDIKLPDEELLIIRSVMDEYADKFIEYHKLRTRKSGHIRHIDMHLVVPKLMTVEMAHTLTHQITGAIEERLAYSHVLVHIEPCEDECKICKGDCPSALY